MKLKSVMLSTMIAAGLGLGSLAVTQPAHADSTAGGTITRSEVLQRAQHWYMQDPARYDGGDTGQWLADIDGGHRYRRDCSGFVSMSLHLTSSPSSFSLSTSTYGVPIAPEDLRPGDYLTVDDGVVGDGEDGHVVLFEGWSPAYPRFTYYGFGGTDGQRNGLRHRLGDFSGAATPALGGAWPQSDDGGNSAGNLDGHPTSRYRAFRYKNIVGSSAASFSGDSRADMVLLGDTFRIWHNNNGQNQGWPWSSEYPAGAGWSGVDPAAVYFADLSGDGKKELVQKNGDGFRVWPNTNGQTAGAFPWGTEFTTGAGWTGVDPSDVYFADITGDGRADLVQRVGDELRYFPNVNGTSFGSPIAAGNGWTGVNSRASYFADITGDGRADMINKSGDGFRVWPNTNGHTLGWPWGTEFTTGIGWTNVVAEDVYFADITGDGKADLVQHNGDELRYFVNTNGAGFGSPIAAGSDWTGVNSRALYFA